MNDKYAPTRVFRPGNTLKQKIGDDVSIRDILKSDVVEEAQQVIDEKRTEFLQWAADDRAAMEAAYARMQDDTVDDAALESLVVCAERMRDRAGTFGYDLASDIARSLVNYTAQLGNDDPHHRIVIRKHLDGIESVFRQNIQGGANRTGVELVENLSRLVAKYQPRG